MEVDPSVDPTLRLDGEAGYTKSVHITHDRPAGHLQFFGQAIRRGSTTILKVHQQGKQSIGTHHWPPLHGVLTAYRMKTTPDVTNSCHAQV